MSVGGVTQVNQAALTAAIVTVVRVPSKFNKIKITFRTISHRFARALSGDMIVEFTVQGRAAAMEALDYCDDARGARVPCGVPVRRRGGRLHHYRFKQGCGYDSHPDGAALRRGGCKRPLACYCECPRWGADRTCVGAAIV